MDDCINVFKSGNKSMAEHLLPHTTRPAEVNTSFKFRSVVAVAMVFLLHLAAYWGWKGIVILLVTEYNCDVNNRDEEGHIALHYAAYNGHLDVVKYFTTELRCAEDRNNIDETPLYIACEKGFLNIAHYLINVHHCNPSCRCNGGLTPLHAACRNGHLDIAKYLIKEAHCSPSCKDSDGETPLHIACHNGHLDIIKYLITEEHCDPSCKDNTGETPLHVACFHKFIHIIQYLLSTERVNPLAENKHGETPLHYAGNDYDIISLFKPQLLSPFVVRQLLDPGIADQPVSDYLLQEVRKICRHLEGSPTAGELREHLDRLYLFAGRNPLEVVGLTEEGKDIGSPIQSSSNLHMNIDKARDKLSYNVTVSITNVTLQGAPATGKTSVIDLAMGRPPAVDRQSTGVAEPPCCSIIVSPEDVEWKELTPDRMLDTLCKTIENLLAQPVDDHTVQHEAGAIPTSSSPRRSPTTSSSDTLPGQARIKFKRDYPQILRDLIERLPKVNEPTTLSEARLILMFDSGGQPNYLDVFPLFVRNKCLAIYTLKLNEKLDAFPQFSYCIQGHSISMADTMFQYTQEQLLESLAKSMSSFLPFLSPSSQCNAQFTIIGTFADKMDECKGETIADKNTSLAKNLKAYEPLRVNYKGKAIFPINAITNDDKQRKEYMTELRRLINKESPCIKVDIKLLWFAFYLTLLSSAEDKQRAILSWQECLAIGRSLDMDEQETRKAIMLFHNLNLIFHYQTEELDNCFVIVDLKPIFDLVSYLIGVSFIDEDELHDLFGIDLPAGVKDHFQNHGCFDKETLEKRFLGKFPELLSAKAFIDLLAKVKAIAIINESNAFFMPCVLRYASREEERKITKDHSCPWIVRLRISLGYTKDYVPLPPSLSPTLIVLLLSSDSFNIDKESDRHQYRNIFTLQFNDEGDVIIVERQLQLEIYYSFSDNECYEIRSHILEAILETKKRLGIADDVKIEESFPCSCSSQTENLQPRHILCKPTSGPPHVQCNLKRKKCDLNKQELRWLVQDIGTATICVIARDYFKTLTVDDLKDVLSVIHDLNVWMRLGIHLGLRYSTLEAIDIEQRSKIENCKMEMLVAWLKQQDNVSKNGVPSWSVLKAALKKIGENELADRIISN